SLVHGGMGLGGGVAGVGRDRGRRNRQSAQAHRDRQGQRSARRRALLRHHRRTGSLRAAGPVRRPRRDRGVRRAHPRLPPQLRRASAIAVRLRRRRAPPWPRAAREAKLNRSGRTMSVEKENKALAIVGRLRDQGFIAYLAGGCVRDRVLGVAAKDYDIATEARPEVVQELFDNTVDVGARFGVIIVVIDGDAFEVATFRADAAYVDGRRPSAVRFGTVEEDARRRDFTIGGMYFDPSSGRIIDLVGGMRDLRAGLIRAIGNAGERFEEDHLRVLRAIRFATRLNFEIDPATWAAMRRAAPKVANIAAERVGEEVVAIMTGGRAARGLELMRHGGLLEAVMPEVLPMVGCEQPQNFHPEGDVYRHTWLALSMLEAGCA